MASVSKIFFVQTKFLAFYIIYLGFVLIKPLPQPQKSIILQSLPNYLIKTPNHSSMSYYFASLSHLACLSLFCPSCHFIFSCGPAYSAHTLSSELNCVLLKYSSIFFYPIPCSLSILVFICILLPSFCADDLTIKINLYTINLKFDIHVSTNFSAVGCHSFLQIVTGLQLYDTELAAGRPGDSAACICNCLHQSYAICASIQSWAHEPKKTKSHNSKSDSSNLRIFMYFFLFWVLLVVVFFLYCSTTTFASKCWFLLNSINRVLYQLIKKNEEF